MQLPDDNLKKRANESGKDIKLFLLFKFFLTQLFLETGLLDMLEKTIQFISDQT